MVCFGLSDLRKKKWDYVKIVKEEKKKAEFGASQCFREERKMEELRNLEGYGIGSTSNGFVTFVFQLELISFGAKGFYCG